MDVLVEVYRDERVSFHACRALFLVKWVEAPTMVQMDALFEHGQAYESGVHGGCGLSNIVVGGTPRFSSEVRKAAADLTSDANLFQRFRLHAILLGGLPGATIQIFVNTFLLLGRPSVPTKAVRDIDEGSRWIREQLDDPTWSTPRVRNVHSKLLDA